MSLNEPMLTTRKNTYSLRDVSDMDRRRDAGENVLTTSAPPVGCRVEEAEPNSDDEAQAEIEVAEPVGCRAETDESNADASELGSVSETAEGGLSGTSHEDPQTPADAIKSRRDFEAFLRRSGFSKAASRAIAQGGWQAIGEPETDAEQQDEFAIAAQDLIALLKSSGSTKG